MLFQRRITVRIAIRIKREAHFVRWRFFARFCRRRWRRRCAGQFFRGLFGRSKFLPEQRARRDLAGWVRFLERFQLPLQLPQRKRHPHLRRDKKCLDKEHRPDKCEHAENEQNQTQSRPAFAGRIGKNKRRQCAWRDLLHEPPIFAHCVRNESRFVILNEVKDLS